MSTKASIRKPAVAGSFYPSNSSRLKSEIDDYLARVPKTDVSGRIFSLIAPHAGYMYSGQVAAHAYNLLINKDIRRVIIISPSHAEYFEFASIFEGDGYETPLGVVDVDKELRQRIASRHSLVRTSDRGHLQSHLSRQEHSLEVHLPFLQQVLTDFTIVPIVMGEQSWNVCEALAEAIAPELDAEDVLVVASTDLSHFHSDRDAKILDSQFCTLLEKMDAQAIYKSIKDRSSEACGAGPVITSLIAGQSAGATSCRILNTANSGDVSGDNSSVVGYVSAVILNDNGQSKSKKKKSEEEDALLSTKERTHLLGLVRQSIAEHLGLEYKKAKPFSTPALERKSGAFVTLKIKGRLRGCIGYIEAIKPLKITITEMARAAAFEDPRFSPLTPEEFPELSVEISVLSPIRPIDDPDDVIVGRHGLIIEKGMNRGLLLPQVPTEYNWSRKEFLEHTCQKAGLPKDAWRDDDARLLVFSAEVFGDE